MIYIESPSTDPYYNLALEEFVFEKLDRSRSYFMLWQNANTVVIGKYQNTAEEIDQEAIDANHTKVVRRLSGGGAVYHDSGNLNFTIITDQSGHEDFNFRVFAEPVVRALAKIGVTAECTGRNDITINGMKFSGNSQYIKNGRILHHGCIMLDSNIKLVSEILKPSKAKFESKAAKSVISRVTTINEHAPHPVSMDEFKELLKNEISLMEPLEPITITAEQQEYIKSLKDSKYATWEWNYGKSPAYNVRKEKKFPSCLLSVFMQVEKGRIESIKFYGDFFGNADIEELEKALYHVSLDNDLERTLEKAEPGRFINGITPKDLYSFLR
ncbi:MAG: lipoate--protein ligase [Lachnospiraceae bacterium]|nr:lipoate--protein ligase [Lachnospiraceae bacterium]